jgi:hypothetical protein
MLIKWATVANGVHGKAQWDATKTQAEARLAELDAVAPDQSEQAENASREAAAIRAALHIQVEVDVSDFWSSHGRAPRGRGAWAFCSVNPHDPDYLDSCIWVNGTFASARSAAIQMARERGITKLYVCA